MPSNLDDLTPIEALYRSRSYLTDYANVLEGARAPFPELIACVRQSSEQMETIAELMTIMEKMFGKMPPVPKRPVGKMN